MFEGLIHADGVEPFRSFVVLCVPHYEVYAERLAPEADSVWGDVDPSNPPAAILHYLKERAMGSSDFEESSAHVEPRLDVEDAVRIVPVWRGAQGRAVRVVVRLSVALIQEIIAGIERRDTFSCRPRVRETEAAVETLDDNPVVQSAPDARVAASAKATGDLLKREPSVRIHPVSESATQCSGLRASIGGEIHVRGLVHSQLVLGNVTVS